MRVISCFSATPDRRGGTGVKAHGPHDPGTLFSELCALTSDTPDSEPNTQCMGVLKVQQNLDIPSHHIHAHWKSGCP